MKKWSTEYNKYKIKGEVIQDWDGCYAIIHPRIHDYYFQVIVGTGMGWDHVSVCLRSRKAHPHADENFFVRRTPFWQEMCWLKDFFFDKSETVVQYHPMESEYVNQHEWVLHLWRPQGIEMPIPQKIMV